MSKLRRTWNRYKDNPTSMSLWKTILFAYQCEYLYWTIFNAISIAMTLLQPFLVKILIRYIKNGENEWAQYGVDFIQFENEWWREHLSPER